MDVKLDTVENFIKRKELVCSLLRDRITLILGQKINYIKTIIFCDDVNNNYRLENLKDNMFKVYLSINILKNALQAGEGQKVLDEVLLTVKNQMI